jgi:excisionase family DNA binding protein
MSTLNPASSTDVQDRTAVGISNRIALTIDEAAQAIGTTRRSVEGMINRGEIKAKLVGRRLLIGTEQLRKFFA